MLTPEYLEAVPESFVDLYSKLDEIIVRDIVRRLVKTGGVTLSAAWQAERLQETGLLYDDIIRKVSGMTNASDAQVKALFEDAGIEAVKYDAEIYKAAGLTPLPLQQSPAAAQVLQAGLKKTQGYLKNLSLTTAATTQTAYINAVTLAEMQAESGAFDYITAIRNAVRDAAQAGTTVLYPSGHIDKLDVAVRRAVLTGVSQTSAQISLKYADDMGCDLVETTAHPGARPDHQTWQGKVFSRSGSGKYPDLKQATGYGTGAGLCGWNCRHSFFPFFEGISASAYPRDKLREYESKTVTYNGNVISYYNATQQQRKMERNIRSTKRELAGYSEGMKSVDEKICNAMRDAFNKSSVKLKQQESSLKDFLSQTGLERQREREQAWAANDRVSGKILSFGKSEAQKAVQANKAVETAANSMYNLGSSQANIMAYFRDKPLRDKIKSETTVKTIEPGQFHKHISGTNEYKQYVKKLQKKGQYGPSRLSISAHEAQRLVDKYCGTGTFGRRKNGSWDNTETITVYPNIIGTVVDNRNGKEAETTVFKIHYRSEGTHIVPDYPSKKGAKARR